MKKLFLTSGGLSALPKFLGKPAKGLKLIFIPTAANEYENSWWLDNDRKTFYEMGFDIIEMDIAGKAKGELEKIFKNVDIIHVGGGNTFYLLREIRKCGFDEIVKKLIDKGVVYIGSSAGACVVGPDIKPIALLEDSQKTPNLKSTKGLNSVNFLVIPHFDDEDFKEGAKMVYEKYKNKFKLLPLNQNQAVLVEGENYRIVKSE